MEHVCLLNEILGRPLLILQKETKVPIGTLLPIRCSRIKNGNQDLCCVFLSKYDYFLPHLAEALIPEARRLKCLAQ